MGIDSRPPAFGPPAGCFAPVYINRHEGRPGGQEAKRPEDGFGRTYIGARSAMTPRPPPALRSGGA